MTDNSAAIRKAALLEAADIAKSYGPSRPLTERRPNPLLRGRWEGEQAASDNIASRILQLLQETV